MRNTQSLLKALAAGAVIFTTLFTACKKDDSSNANNPSGSAHIEMRLTDGPGNFDAV